MSIFGKKGDPAEPLLLKTEITFARSVIHSCIQTSGRSINEALGAGDDALLDEFLATESGKLWAQGFRQYAIHVLSKSI